MINNGSQRPPLAPMRQPAQLQSASKPDPVERKLDAMAGADAEAALALETGISVSDCEEEEGSTTSCHAHTSNRSVPLIGAELIFEACVCATSPAVRKVQSWIRLWQARSAYKKTRKARLSSLAMVLRWKKSLMSERNSLWQHLSSGYTKIGVASAALAPEGEESVSLASLCLQCTPRILRALIAHAQIISGSRLVFFAWRIADYD